MKRKIVTMLSWKSSMVWAAKSSDKRKSSSPQTPKMTPRRKPRRLRVLKVKEREVQSSHQLNSQLRNLLLKRRLEMSPQRKSKI